MGGYCQFCKYKTFWGGCYNDACVGGNRFESLITPEKFSRQMIRIKNTYANDPEVCHGLMDDFMCETLYSLGYDHGVKVFTDTKKYYA